MHAALIAVLAVAVLLAVLGLWDVERYLADKETISNGILTACKRWPILPFLVGAILGGLAAHFCWPQYLPK